MSGRLGTHIHRGTRRRSRCCAKAGDRLPSDNSSRKTECSDSVCHNRNGRKGQLGKCKSTEDKAKWTKKPGTHLPENPIFLRSSSDADIEQVTAGNKGDGRPEEVISQTNHSCTLQERKSNRDGWAGKIKSDREAPQMVLLTTAMTETSTPIPDSAVSNESNFVRVLHVIQSGENDLGHPSYRLSKPMEYSRAADDTTYGIQSLAEDNVELQEERDRSGRTADNTTFCI